MAVTRRYLTLDERESHIDEMKKLSLRLLEDRLTFEDDRGGKAQKVGTLIFTDEPEEATESPKDIWVEVEALKTKVAALEKQIQALSVK